jgi:hypothetical protein
LTVVLALDDVAGSQDQTVVGPGDAGGGLAAAAVDGDGPGAGALDGGGEAVGDLGEHALLVHGCSPVDTRSLRIV